MAQRNPPELAPNYGNQVNSRADESDDSDDVWENSPISTFLNNSNSKNSIGMYQT